MSILLLLVVVPAEYVDYALASDMLGASPLNFEHGWPWPYLHRQIDPPTTTPIVELPHHGVPWLQKSAWSFGGTIVSWSPRMLLIDVLVVIGILIVVATGLEWRHRRQRLWQISLAEFMVCMLLICAALGGWMGNLNTSRRESDAITSYSGVSYGLGYCGPRLLRRAVGIDYLQPFHRVVFLNINQASTLALSDISNEFPYVNNISLRSTEIDDDDLDHVALLPHLERLTVRNSPSVTDAGLGHLERSRKLRAIVMTNCTGITGNGLHRLADLNDLALLALTECRVENAGLRDIARLSQLTSLNLQDTNVDDDGLRALKTLVNLRELGLAGTNINGNGLVHLRNLRKLEALNLDRTVVGDDNLNNLEQLANLKRLNIRETIISNDVAAKLRKRLPNCLVVYH